MRSGGLSLSASPVRFLLFCRGELGIFALIPKQDGSTIRSHNPEPIPGEIKLAHGAGGRLSHQLARDFARLFNNEYLAPLADSAVLQFGTKRLAFTTDSHVIKPLFFPGGDIGRLAVYGTVNDLAVMGARPQYLSCALILEEGFPRDELDRILKSMAEAAGVAGVQIVTGDTKVVNRRETPELFINTAGIGALDPQLALNDEPLQPGDTILVSGTLGDHAAAVLTVREGLRFDSPLISDCAPLNDLIQGVLRRSRGVKWMRDPTRGGLAAVLNELVENGPLGIEIEERAIPIKPEVSSLCELLGFDPLHLANEGKVVLVVRAQDAETVLATLKEHPLGHQAALIGRLTDKPAGRVILHTLIGGHRILDMPAGELLPRIC